MHRSEVFVDRVSGCGGSWPENPSTQLVQVAVAQYCAQAVRSQETAALVTSQPGKTHPFCSSDQMDFVVKGLAQRAIAPRHFQVDLGCSNLKCNYQSLDWYLPQEDIPSPRIPVKLEDDEALTDWLQKPGGVEFTRIQLAKRNAALEEGKGGSFTFKPLMTSLRNMKTVVCHIGAGNHFPDDHPLTDNECRALQWLQERAEVLLHEQAPYELTVNLCFAFLAVYEVMLARRVVPPRDSTGRLGWLYMRLDVEPDEITAYSWGGNNTTGPKCREDFCSRDLMTGIGKALTGLLKRPNMLLYPSFQALGIEDFCRFGHLPVYPIGMLADFACNADGMVLSPLEFASHDIAHTNHLRKVSMGKVETRRAAEVMGSSEHRLVVRQMLLDHTPTDLHFLKPGLRILQFHLLHEISPAKAGALLENDNLAFLRCLERVLGTLRWWRAGYLPDDRSITDSEAFMAALWGARLLCDWRAAGFKPLSPQQQEARARIFRKQDLPLLQQHLAFVAQHRGTLRQMFIAGYSTGKEDTQERFYSETDFASKSGLLLQARLCLFDSYDPDSGLCNLDNIDLAYFAALASAKLRDEMEQCTAARLPEGIVFASDIPQPSLGSCR